MPEYFFEIGPNGAGVWGVGAITFYAGLTYYIEVEGSATGAGTLSDPMLEVREAFYIPWSGWESGGVIASDDDGGVGRNARLVITPTETTNYIVYGLGYGGSAGTFRMRVFEDDFRNSVEGVGAASFVAAGRNGSGNLNYAGDADMFETSLISGLTYTLEQQGVATGSGTLADPYLYLYNTAGSLLASNDDAGTLNSSIAFTATTSGAHFLQAREYWDNSTGTFRIYVSEGVANDANNTIVGTAAPDAVNAAGGNDNVSGGDGNDWLRGGSGNDLLSGQAHADVLTGGRGTDVLIGGSGFDRFVFSAWDESPATGGDVIRGDYDVSAFELPGLYTGDRIDLQAIDANTLLDGNQAFLFGGAGTGQVSLVESGTNTILRGNVDADADFELAIVIEDGSVRASAYFRYDFIL